MEIIEMSFESSEATLSAYASLFYLKEHLAFIECECDEGIEFDEIDAKNLRSAVALLQKVAQRAREEVKARL